MVSQRFWPQKEMSKFPKNEKVVRPGEVFGELFRGRTLYPLRLEPQRGRAWEPGLDAFISAPCPLFVKFQMNGVVHEEPQEAATKASTGWPKVGIPARGAPLAQREDDATKRREAIRVSSLG